MMTNIPANLRYSSSHTWVEVFDGDSVRVGITDFSQLELGEIIYVELPNFERSYTVGEECAVIESAEMAIDIYCPIGGEIIDVNNDLDDNPALINADPYGEGWLFQLRPDNDIDIDELVDAEDYAEQIELEQERRTTWQQ